MRKQIIGTAIQQPEEATQNWLKLEEVAAVELSSEHEDHPIEAAFRSGSNIYWLANEAGEQTIRLLFDKPQKLSSIRLSFNQGGQARTQEFVLRWSSDEGVTYNEIVRQQYCFSSPDALLEREQYQCDINRVTHLELVITPDISGGHARARLDEWFIASTGG